MVKLIENIKLELADASLRGMGITYMNHEESASIWVFGPNSRPFFDDARVKCVIRWFKPLHAVGTQKAADISLAEAYKILDDNKKWIKDTENMP